MRKRVELSSEEKLYNYLVKKYDTVVLTKEQLREELGIAKSTLDLYISKNEGIPPYKKLGNAKNSRVIFHAADVAKFLDETVATTY